MKTQEERHTSILDSRHADSAGGMEAQTPLALHRQANGHASPAAAPVAPDDRRRRTADLADVFSGIVDRMSAR